jgi:multidrug resistance efflux pump
MDTIRSFFSSKPADPVAAAQTKVDSAQATLDKAKEQVTRLEGELNTAKTELEQAKNTVNTVPLANTSDGVKGGRRARTYRKEKRPAKRRRNARRSIRS